MNPLIEVGETENGKQVELHLDQTLRITLSETPTSGYRWYVRSTERVVSLVRDSTVPSPPEGAGGTVVRQWDFQAQEVGTARVAFEYARAWERHAMPAREFSLSVHVI
jgi:predicted secreted protein